MLFLKPDVRKIKNSFFTELFVFLDLLFPASNLIFVLQYCAKEMQTKFAEIREITRISAIKLRTFASDEKAANFFASIVLMSAKFRKQGDLIETKFRCEISCPLDEISCH